ncbi:MAG: alcohol dehydrogenase catalytic domain-containing protein [Micropepsaceae bacterium]
MKALVYEAPGRVALQQVARPVAGPGEVLIQVAAAGVCGTDRHIVAGHLGVAPGTVLGHEVCGRIAEVGQGVSGFAPSDRVIAFGQVVCGQCAACRSGRDNRCARPEILGMGRQGAFAEFIALPTRALIPLPQGISDAVGAIVPDAIATPYHAVVAVGGLRPGETVVVIGAGGVGAHAILIARTAGAARIVAVDTDAGAREAALAFGADVVFDPREDAAPAKALRKLARNASLVVECVGREETTELAFAAVAPGGRVVIVGVGSARPKLPALLQFVGNEIAVMGSFGSTKSEIETVLQLIVAGRLDVSRSISRSLPLTAAAKVFAEPPTPARTVFLPGAP